MAAGLCMPQILCSAWLPLVDVSPQRKSARAWVSGSSRATSASQGGNAVIGNKDPAKKKGTMAMAGKMPTYSSVLGTRAARISARPYMTIANSSAATTNQNTRLVVSYWAPRNGLADPEKIGFLGAQLSTAPP